MAASFKTDWAPDAPLDILVSSENDNNVCRRFRGEWDALKEHGLVNDSFLKVIPRTGGKRIHTRHGILHLQRMAKDWRVELDSGLFAHVVTCAILRKFGVTPLDDTEIESWPSGCWDRWQVWQYDG